MRVRVCVCVCVCVLVCGYMCVTNTPELRCRLMAPAAPECAGGAKAKLRILCFMATTWAGKVSECEEENGCRHPRPQHKDAV
jgi:hypothetical protein